MASGCPLCAVRKMTGRAPQSPGRRLSRVTASILPAAVLVLLPKCPLCLAAWLTVATGVSFSAASAAWVRASILLLCVAALLPMLWRRALRLAKHVAQRSGRSRIMPAQRGAPALRFRVENGSNGRPGE
jgi:hypothetical protein